MSQLDESRSFLRDASPMRCGIVVDQADSFCHHGFPLVLNGPFHFFVVSQYLTASMVPPKLDVQSQLFRLLWSQHTTTMIFWAGVVLL